MLSRKTTLLAGLLLALAGCGKEKEPMRSSVSSDAIEPSSDNGSSAQSVAALVSRQTIVTMTFTKWGDIIAVDTALTKAADGRCKFVEPIISDDSTKWSPFQIYWVIFDRASDVKNGTELSGIFGDGDTRISANLRRADGATPFGFSYLSAQAAGYVKLTPVTFFDDGTRIQTVLDISGHKAAIRSIAEDRDGTCKARTEACVGGESCYSNGSFSPLGNIHVVQSMLGLPKEVRQQPSNGVTHGK